MKRTIRKWLHWLSPTRCACCSTVIYHDQTVCETCAQALPMILPGICAGCGEPIKKCSCYRQPRTHIPCVSPWFYQGTIKQGVLALKRGRSLHGVSFFGEQMGELVHRCYGTHFDGVVYVPMYGKTQRENHSRYLAKAMAEYLGIPLLDTALTRLYPTPSQHRLGLSKRKGNVFGTFEADAQQVAGKHILLVDDIITTGTTLDECAKMLLLADCEEVCAVTVASTPLAKERKEVG